MFDIFSHTCIIFNHSDEIEISLCGFYHRNNMNTRAVCQSSTMKWINGSESSRASIILWMKPIFQLNSLVQHQKYSSVCFHFLYSIPICEYPPIKTPSFTETFFICYTLEHFYSANVLRLSFSFPIEVSTDHAFRRNCHRFAGGWNRNSKNVWLVDCLIAIQYCSDISTTDVLNIYAYNNNNAIPHTLNYWRIYRNIFH